MFDYYVHFNKDTGDIYSITNESVDTIHEVTTVPYADVEKFLSGHENFVNYKVSLRDRTNYKLIKRLKISSFQLERLYAIPNVENIEAEFSIVKDATNKKWIFSVNENKKNELLELDVNFRLRFFIVKETNFDHMIRELTVDTIDLGQSPVVELAFEKPLEDTTNIAIVTSKFFETYSLRLE